MNRQQRGYTLVEMIVALALTGLIMATLGGALYGLGQGFARATVQAESMDRVFRVSQSLRLSLSRLSIGRRDPKLLSIEGGGGRVSWLAPLPESAPISGLYRWSLSGERGQLELHLTELAGGSIFPAKPLIDDLIAFHVSFQDPLSGQWVDAWSERTLPRRVRLSIKSVKRGEWPAITVLLGGGA